MEEIAGLIFMIGYGIILYSYHWDLKQKSKGDNKNDKND